MRSGVSVLAIVFGVVTVFAGTRVLGGSSPGYIVYVPLLLFNTVMGVVYVLAGITVWRKPRLGALLAAAIAASNLLVLVFISLRYLAGAAVARESLQAMTFRTVVWVMFWLGLVWAGRNVGGSK